MSHRNTPLRLSPQVWLSVIRGGWTRASMHNMGLIAAGVAFYLFLAMVPLLAAIIMLYGIVADPAVVANHIAELSSALPAAAADIVTGQLESVVESSGAAKGIGLAAALALALFGARNGAGSMMIALNVAFDCKEQRGFVDKNIAALAITAGGAFAAVLLFAGIGAFSALQAFVAPDSPLIAVLSHIITSIVLILAISTCVAILFRYAPACNAAPLHWLSPGSLFAAIVAAVLTFAFGIYVANFGNYNATYGSLGGVVVLLTWLWLTSYVILIGAECDVALVDRAGAPMAD